MVSNLTAPLRGLLLMLLVLCSVAAFSAANVRLAFPLMRHAYQTNEGIDLAVMRSDTQALPADTLTITLNGEDASTFTFTFPVKAVALVNGNAMATEHLQLNARLLAPGNYQLTAAVNGASAQDIIEVYSHLRKSSFRIGDWGSSARPGNGEQAILGEAGMGFNLLYANGNGDDSVRGGLDYMGNDVMGGGHQMELRLECDWSDPYVLQGATGHAAQAAFSFRKNGNAIGVHFYDEPGLTWWENPVNKQWTPHDIPWQLRQFKAAFGEDALRATDFKDTPVDFAKWQHWGKWKESFMEATWKISADTVRRVDPSFISATQTVYGWSAYTDGYYFNITRQLPVISGHGGYDDFGYGFFNPSLYHEFGRIRDLNKPNWYLPTWYNNMPSDRFRMEQYLSFMTNLQGMMKPPGMEVHQPYKHVTSEGIVESNKEMSRLGTIFTTMPVTRAEVAVLYSISNNLYRDTLQHTGKKDNTDWQSRLGILYIVSKLTQTPIFPIVEEDIVDGTAAAYHKVILLTGIEYLDPKVISALEQYIAMGGIVILGDECTVQIKGAQKMGMQINNDFAAQNSALWMKKQDAQKAGKTKEELDAIDQEMAEFNTVGNMYKLAQPLVKAVSAKFAKLGIKPTLTSDVQSIIATQQSFGDIDYIFAVNATYDEKEASMNSIKGTKATLTIADNGGTLYDAMRGGATEFKKKGTSQVATISFGAGQMRVFARTARPIGRVELGTPTIFTDYSMENAPLYVTITGTIVDDKGKVLVGSVPLEITLTSPLKATRYLLHRATDRGSISIDLPLAINDPAGIWTVTITELLNNTSSSTTFNYRKSAMAGAVAGATERAVTFGKDRERIYNFFRTQNNVTMVIGTSPYLQAAAERLATTLKPWNIDCTIINAADAKKKSLNEDEVLTWVGRFGHAGKGLKVGDGNSLTHVGYDIPGSVMLFGTPEDNPLIKYLQDHDFLAYKADANFPGPGRGYLAWQVDGLGFQQESVACIAYDEAGMNEAIGSVYEAAVGIDPLTRLVTPVVASVTTASKNIAPAAATQMWSAFLPDRAISITLAAGNVLITTFDGTVTTMDINGKTLSQKAGAPVVWPVATAPKVPEVLRPKLAKYRVPKYIAEGNNQIAVGHWGGTVQIFAQDGTPLTQQQFAQDIAAMIWNGQQLVVALADGKVVAVKVP